MNKFDISITAQDEASKKINRVVESINGAGKAVNGMNKKIANAGSGFKTDEMQRAFGKITQSADRTIEQLAGLSPALGSLISGGAGVAGLIAMTKSFGDFGRSVTRSSLFLGESRQQMQAWHLAAKRAGLDESSTDAGLSGMQDAIRGANNGSNGLAASWLAANNIKIERDESGNVKDYDAVIKDSLRALSQIKSAPGQRAAAGVMGAGSLLPLIQRPWETYLKDAYNSGQIKSDDDIAKGDRLHENLEQLNSAINSLTLSIGGNLAPQITAMANSITAYINENHEKAVKQLQGAGEGGAVALALRWLPKALKLPGFGLYAATRSEDLNSGEDEWLKERDRRESLGMSIPPADWKTNSVYQMSVKSEPKAQPSGGASSAGQSAGGQPSGVARGIRNNNPGNIEYGDFAKRMGATGSDGRFAIFPTMDQGKLASMSLLNGYVDKGYDSIDKIIHRWAPSNENNTSAYVNAVASSTGLDSNQKLNKDQLSGVADAIFKHENGSSYQPSSQPQPSTRQEAAQFNINVYSKLPGVRVDVSAPGGTPPQARINYAMASAE